VDAVSSARTGERISFAVAQDPLAPVEEGPGGDAIRQNNKSSGSMQDLARAAEQRWFR